MEEKEERIVIWCSKKLKHKWEIFKVILDFDNDELLEFLLRIGDEKIGNARGEELEELMSLINKIKEGQL